MIHKFKFDKSNIVMDIHSGSVHIVDDVTYDMVEEAETLSKEELVARYKGKYKQEAIEEAYDELMALKEQEMLYTEDQYEKLVPAFMAREPVVKALCLHVAHDCNLKCQYCFAEEGEYHGCRSMMSAEVAKKSIDFMIENSGHRKQIEIDFFGGEPLMNWEVVKETVAYARAREIETGKLFRFTMTTNGMLLDDEKIEYLNKHMYNVVLSMDGRKEVNDKMRPTPNGKGSYDIIVPKFKRLVEKRGDGQYYLRGTFTHHNLDFFEDVKHMNDIGFDEVSVEPVVAPSTMDYALQVEDIPMICEQYEKLAYYMLEKERKGEGFNFFHFKVDLQGGPCIHKRLAGCGSGTEYLAVTPQGDLFPCHQFVGLEQFKMGNVFEGIQNKQIRCDFEKCNVYSKKECKSCWAKFYCSGGCSANSYNFHGDIHHVYEVGCELEKKRLECAIGLQAALSE